ncbi:hypothetical protein [Erwinia persicina]|uniref:Uncharacterized protein n=1 Tax=Erwinia persicina TaxID=55211 RepID=A0A4U3F7G6_9GAMM|nr:hypothetical protein [Erwinia persicina]TKJ89070.1 hypothetical protein EpCFBP13511_14580 [Erwinia persicina]
MVIITMVAICAVPGGGGARGHCPGSGTTGLNSGGCQPDLPSLSRCGVSANVPTTVPVARRFLA